MCAVIFSYKEKHSFGLPKEEKRVSGKFDPEFGN